jgi:MFS family permease
VTTTSGHPLVTAAAGDSTAAAGAAPTSEALRAGTVTVASGPATAEMAAGGGQWQAFARFWWCQVAGQLCSRTAQLVFPLVAVTAFGAGAAAVGVVNALQYLPVFAVSALLGGMLDHWDRRRVFVLAYLVDALAFVAVLLAYAAGVPRVPVLVAACAVVGTSVALTDLCAQTMPPDLVPPRLLVTANSRMEVIYNAGQIAAPGLAGIAVQLLGGSATLVLLAAVAAAAAVLAARLRLPWQGYGVPRPQLRSRLAGAVEGARFLLGDPVLRPLALQGAAYNLLEQAVLTLYLVYAVRVWGFSSGLVGLTITVGGLGTVLASVAVGLAGRRVRPVAALAGGMGLASLPIALVPLAAGPRPVLAACGAGAFFLVGLGITGYNIFAVSLRQRLSPPGSLARVAAGYRLLAWSPVALGAVLGGVAGQLFGLRLALWLSVAALAACWLLFSRRAVRLAARFEQVLAAA